MSSPTIFVNSPRSWKNYPSISRPQELCFSNKLFKVIHVKTLIVWVWLRFAKHNLALDIRITYLDLPREGEAFPVLSVTDTVDYLIRSKNLSKLIGDIPFHELQPTLLEFWRRYSLEWPDFELFKATGNDLALCRCIPVYIHGDEGRGFKRSGVMILSLQGAIGRGSRPFQRRHPLLSLRKIKMGINLQGSSFNSRFLFTAMPKKYYAKNPESRFFRYNAFFPGYPTSCSVNFVFPSFFRLAAQSCALPGKFVRCLEQNGPGPIEPSRRV